MVRQLMKEEVPGLVARMVEQLLARRKDLDRVRKGSAVTYYSWILFIF